MKLLIIGNASHQYNLAFTKWLKKNHQAEVTAIDISFKAYNGDDYDNFFSINGNKTLLNTKIIGSIYRAYLVKDIFTKNNIENQTILLQAATPWLSFIFSFLKKKTSNLSIALWGSDFYRYKRRKVLKKMFTIADNILICHPQMIEDFSKEFNQFHKKTNLCYFGIEPIESIKKILNEKADKQESLKRLGFNDSLLNIVIGHNGSIHNKHLEVLESLANFPKLKDVRIILPMTYGANPEYLKAVDHKCSSMSLNYKILTVFMSDEDVAHLRIITDVMINVQTTDAFSGSMREVLYSGGVVINGSWLPYQFIKNQGVYYEEVDKVKEIGAKVDLIIQNFNSFSKKAENNSEKIYELSSWSKTIKAWAQVLNK